MLPISSPPSATDAANTADADADRASCGVWLTNALLWLKRGGLSAKVEEAWFGEPAVSFLLEQIEIVRPRVIVALGQNAYDCVLRAYSLPKRRGAFRNVVAGPGVALPTATPSILIGVYHCGQRIQNTIRTLDEQMHDWQHVAESLSKQ